MDAMVFSRSAQLANTRGATADGTLSLARSQAQIISYNARLTVVIQIRVSGSQIFSARPIAEESAASSVRRFVTWDLH